MLLPSLSLDFYLQLPTAYSANPLDAGWYGSEVICSIPFPTRNEANSSLTKHDPLSDAIVSGIPN